MDIILVSYMTDHNYIAFCNQKQGSTKNVHANSSDNLNGTTYFFSSLASLARYLRHKSNVLYNQAQAQIHSSHITPMLTSLLNKNNTILLYLYP